MQQKEKKFCTQDNTELNYLSNINSQCNAQELKLSNKNKIFPRVNNILLG